MNLGALKEWWGEAVDPLRREGMGGRLRGEEKEGRKEGRMGGRKNRDGERDKKMTGLVYG